ncbi:hypothetical protein CPC08DRAFT_729461 [Agrocybe pediades]|nr:hypothetical protein CPC08DRAFT_729461 [Agrocybe pediades]
MSATPVFANIEAYMDAVHECNAAISASINIPGADLVNLMHSIKVKVDTIFETRRQKQLSHPCVGETFLVHRFAGRYIKATNEGKVIGEDFRKAMQVVAAKLLQRKIPPAVTSGDPAPAAPPKSTPQPTPTPAPSKPAPAKDARPELIEGEPAPSKPAPSKPAPSKPIPTKSSTAKATADADPMPASSTSKNPPHTSTGPPAPPTTKPDSMLPSKHANKVVNAVKRIAEVKQAAVEAVVKRNKGQGGNRSETAAASPSGSKGKTGEVRPAGPENRKRKREREPQQRAAKRAYHGSGLYYQIPCDLCERMGRPCEKKADQKLLRKAGFASCVTCARSGKKCERAHHPKIHEKDLVLVKRAVPAKSRRRETEDEEEDEQMVAAKGKKGKGKEGRKYVETTEDDMLVDEEEEEDDDGEEEEEDAEGEDEDEDEEGEEDQDQEEVEEKIQPQKKKAKTSQEYVEETETEQEIVAAHPNPRKPMPKAKSVQPGRQPKHRHVALMQPGVAGKTPQMGAVKPAAGTMQPAAMTKAVPTSSKDATSAANPPASHPTVAGHAAMSEVRQPSPAIVPYRQLEGFHTASQFIDPPVDRLPHARIQLDPAPSIAAFPQTRFGRLRMSEKFDPPYKATGLQGNQNALQHAL